MTKLSTYDLSPLYRNSIGLDRLMSHMVQRLDTGSTGNYPPYNIITDGEDKYTIELAIAGFTADDVHITVENGQLKVEGAKENDDTREFIHQGIGFRRFIRVFDLADYVEVINASFEHGVLTIELERIVPESMKPKTIAIEYKS
jgi:molecular chaperone IbpA